MCKHPLILAFVLSLAITSPLVSSSANPATPSVDGTPVMCPVSEPNGVQPPESGNAFGRGWGDFGNAALWTSLWTWGEGVVWVPDDGHVQDGVAREMKWPWYRFVSGDLAIEGRRLDGDSPPLEAWIPNGSYGESGFIATGLTFPSEGCWEITGTIGSESLTFVVLVLFPPDFNGQIPPWATPVATPT